MRGQIVNNKGFSGPHGKKGRMMGSFETVEALQSQQMFDPSTAHLALNTLNPFHLTSLFLVFHCSSRPTKLSISSCGPQIFIHNHSYCPFRVILTL